MPGPRLVRLASDARLVSFVREGRAGAFDAIYDRHSRAILSFCRHMLGDQHEAEDAVQHTFMSAYSSLLSSQQTIQLRPWLFAIARNRCYSILRSQRERPVGELEEPVTEGLAAEVQRRQDLQDLVSDLNGLPEEQRAAIILAELESLSHAEIGEALGVPRDKVKALVFQARESLLASRTARDTACHEIRQQLAVGRGGALRRSNLRRHLRDCEGCRAYRTEVQHQRRQFGLLLPVAPTLLAKEGVVAAALGASGAAAVGGSGLIAGGALKTGLLKGVAAAVIAGVGTLGTVVVSASDLPIRAFDAGSGNPRHAIVRPAHHSGLASHAANTSSTAPHASSGYAATGAQTTRSLARHLASASATRRHHRTLGGRGSSTAHHRHRHRHGGAAGRGHSDRAGVALARRPSVSLLAGYPAHVLPGLASRTVTFRAWEPAPIPGRRSAAGHVVGGAPGHVHFGFGAHGNGGGAHGNRGTAHGNVGPAHDHIWSGGHVASPHGHAGWDHSNGHSAHSDGSRHTYAGPPAPPATAPSRARPFHAGHFHGPHFLRTPDSRGRGKGHR